MTAELDRARSLVVEIPDHPEAGVLFRDIAPMLADARALRAAAQAMIEPFAGSFDAVAGIEARGFLLAGAAAVLSGTGLVPIRKAGRLPRPAASAEYELEYGSDRIEMHADLPAGARVLLVDDVLATGGTLQAACGLVPRTGAEVAGVSVLLELAELGGRERLRGIPLHALWR
ncbi:MAG: adenine phosphoribosyltransferase [Pseudoclavibacter sp.]|nr:adenine phosphoribosyltransferase [Pseudoclavibacter sp.]